MSQFQIFYFFLIIFLYFVNFSSNYKILQPRIIGGKDSKIGLFPYQISIELFENHLCGGSIISKNLILTAGHCVKGYSPLWMKIRAGTIYLKNNNENGELYNVETYILHPMYEMDETSIYDIAILKLEKSLNFSENISSIQLIDKNYKFLNNEKALIMGWGYTQDEEEEDGDLSKILQYAVVPIINRKDCQKLLKMKYHPSSFCAGYIKTGKIDSCSYDSGGPIVSISSGKQIGIVSWGDGCGKPGKPGVYTNIQYVKKWIDETIKELS